MHFIVLAGILLVSLVLFLGATVTFGKPKENKPVEDVKPAQSVSVTAVKSMSKAEIEKMLTNIETSKAPQPKMGAMCYSPAGPPKTAEYIRPICSEKTVYGREYSRFVTWELQACRRDFQVIEKSTKLKMSLDESSFCKHCKPDAEEHKLVLTMTFADGSTHTNKVSRYDLRMLRDFFSGKLSYETFNDGERPLKSELLYLKELFGFVETGTFKKKMQEKRAKERKEIEKRLRESGKETKENEF